MQWSKRRDHYLSQLLAVLGLHNGIGPPSACRIGVATKTYVQAKPTIRITILTARFMGMFSLLCGSPGSGNPHGAELYSAPEMSLLFSLQCCLRIEMDNAEV